MITSSSIKMLFFGDFVASLSCDIVLDQELITLTGNADIVGCNFEAPITTELKGISKSGIPIKQNIQTAAWLKASGFNLLQIANNHMFDYGEKGLSDTIEALSAFTVIGAGAFHDAYKIKEIKIKNKKIGLISFSHREFGIVDEESQNGVAWINHFVVGQIIQKNRNYFDYIIALPHAGVELIDVPLPEWRSRYKQLIDLGVDAVIGTHPHIPQGWEFYKKKPIFYSLGNFYFDAATNPHPYWNKSLAIELILDQEITFNIHNISFKENYIGIDKCKERAIHNEYLCNLLNDDTKYKNYLEKKVDDLYNQYEVQIKRSMGVFQMKGNWRQVIRGLMDFFKGKKDDSYLLNTFQCESHSWLIQRALNSKIQNHE